MMKTSLRIVLRSWQLPWQEKRLLILPVLLLIANHTIDYLIRILNLELTENPYTNPKWLITLLFEASLSIIIYTLIAPLSVAIAFQVLDAQQKNFIQIIADLLYRVRHLFIFTLINKTLFTLPVFFVFFVRLFQFPAFWDQFDLSWQVSIYELLINFVFLLTLPTLVSENGQFYHLLRRSWRYCSANAGIILRSLPGLLFTLALLLVAKIVLDNVFNTWVSVPKILFAFYGLLARNYVLLIALPVCWSYQALLYQHARARESAKDP